MQEELEKHLNRGEQWGFRKRTNSPNYLGWILIHKRKPPTIWAKEAYENEEVYNQLLKQETLIKHSPYHLVNIELKRDIHEKGEYESADDYRLWENHYFSTLEEVTNFLEENGYKLEDIKFRGEIDAP